MIKIFKCNKSCPYYTCIKENIGHCNNDLCIDGFVAENEECRIEQIKKYFNFMEEKVEKEIV